MDISPHLRPDRRPLAFARAVGSIAIALAAGSLELLALQRLRWLRRRRRR
ncbi:MAG: hypothetical protein AB7P21_26120 [Lautropia sp.]